MLTLYPAIDLKDGQCVRLVRGEMDQATVFNDDPGDQAARFAAAGCDWIHVVDLNGAFAGRPVNAEAVRAIVRGARGLKIELGGGIRDLATIEAWLNAGVTRAILGTVALRDPGLVKQACKAFPGQVAVGIDAKDGMVAVEGWAEVSEITALDLGLRFEDAGVDVIIHTDIARDGAMGGPNVAATADLAARLSMPLIVSGGVSSMADLQAVKDRAAPGIEGVIVGRAIYDGRVDPVAAVALLKGGTPC